MLCFAYGARNASAEEGAFRKGSCDKRRVLEAALRRGNRIAGVRDKPLGGIVECDAGAEERFHASRAKAFRLILERALEEPEPSDDYAACLSLDCVRRHGQ